MDQRSEFSDSIYNKALVDIEDKVMNITNLTLDKYGLPTTNREENDSLSRELLRELNYDEAELCSAIETQEPALTEDQSQALKVVMDSVSSKKGRFLFLDAPGGTGKTFLTNLILAKIRLGRGVAVAVASSGIAATLLAGGRTAHSTFKLPLNMTFNENPTCNFPKNSGTAEVLKRAKLLVWDEATMAHKRAFEAIDRTLRDVRQSNQIFGGLTVLICGDFRQTLPVIPRGTPADELSACLKSSPLWSHVQIIRLRTNMRVYLSGDEGAGKFAATLLKLGNGHVKPESDGNIEIPTGCGQIVESSEELVAKVYPSLHVKFVEKNWLKERGILAPTNDTVGCLNSQLLEKIPGNVKVYKSIDNTLEQNDAVNFPTEFLNSLDPSGLPSHELRLKVGVPIMLLRNLDPPRLCNGTRLTIKRMMANVIEATIITGKFTGEDVLLPRIPLIPTDYPFQFKRLQFPIKLSFAMTINKAQGQSLKCAGLHLEPGCFSHGQFYVGCSRVGNPENLYIFAREGKTKNIVYQQALK